MKTRGITVFGTCYSHISPRSVSGEVQWPDSHTHADRIHCTRLGDLVLMSCGHYGIVATSSVLTDSLNIKVARVGDLVTGYDANITAVIKIGSKKVFANK